MRNKILSQIKALADNVWLEAIRDKMLIILTGFGVLFMLFSVILGQMAIGGQDRIIQNMGFWVMGIWGLVAVVYLGSNIVRQEIQRQTIYLILARPVHRVTLLMGKFFGILIVLLVMFILLSLIWIILLKFNAIDITSRHFWALLFIMGEWILLLSFSLFFASFTSPLLHNFFLVGMTFLGHWSNDLRVLAERVHSLWLKNLLNFFYYILPNLEALNFREAALYNQAISSALLLEGTAVLIAWISFALIAANLLFFNRKLL